MKIDGFAKIDFGETHFFNGSVQRRYHVQRHQSLRELIVHALSFQKRHHLSLYLSMAQSAQLCREARFVVLDYGKVNLKRGKIQHL